MIPVGSGASRSMTLFWPLRCDEDDPGSSISRAWSQDTPRSVTIVHSRVGAFVVSSIRTTCEEVFACLYISGMLNGKLAADTVPTQEAFGMRMNLCTESPRWFRMQIMQ